MSLLPGQILPESVPFGQVDAKGKLFVDHNWYLFLYNLAIQALSGQSSGTFPTSQADLIDMVDLDAQGADTPPIDRAIANLLALQPTEDISPSAREAANAIIAAVQETPPDPLPQAQPAQSVTVGASPFTYTALFSGCAFVSGGTVSSISVIRQGSSFSAGATSGPIPLRRLDQLQITYSAAPAVVFFPD